MDNTINELKNNVDTLSKIYEDCRVIFAKEVQRRNPMRREVRAIMTDFYKLIREIKEL